MPEMTAPLLAGVHHLKLPVSDLARSRAWYESRLGYQVQTDFMEDGVVMGYAMEHPNGGPPLGLRLDPARARAAAGFDYFAIGVPDKASIDALAERLTALGDEHAGVHVARQRLAQCLFRRRQAPRDPRASRTQVSRTRGGCRRRDRGVRRSPRRRSKSDPS